MEVKCSDKRRKPFPDSVIDMTDIRMYVVQVTRDSPVSNNAVVLPAYDEGSWLSENGVELTAVRL